MKKFISLVNRGAPDYRQGAVQDYWFRYALFFALLFATPSLGDYTVFDVLRFVLCLVAVIVGIVFIAKPSIIHLVPISYKRRTFYYYLSIVAFSVIGILIVLVGAGIVFGLVWLIVYLSAGSNIIVEETAEAITSLSAQAYLFAAFKMVFCFFAVAAILRFSKTRNYIIAAVCYLVVTICGDLLLVGLASGESELLVMGSLYENFSSLPNPTLAVVLCGVAAVLSAVGSVLFVLYKEKPKKF